MEQINCTNFQKYLADHNQEVNKAFQNIPDSNLKVESILGAHTQELKESPIFILSPQEVLYFSQQYFLVHNLISKQYAVIRICCFNHKTIFIDHFISKKKTHIFFTILRYKNSLYIGQLQILGSLTEQNNIVSQVQSEKFRWKLSKMTNKCNYLVENMAYHSVKNYVYMIASQINDNKKYLWIYDLNRQSMIMSSPIKSSLPKVIIDRVWVTEEPTEVYLIGKNYFRFWTLGFNQKCMKQSNYRNIQRSLCDKQILKLFYCHYKNSKVLGVLTGENLMLLGKNELIDVQSPPERLLKRNKNKDNIQAQLQNSLSQIYRMNFLVDQEENNRKEIEDFTMTPETNKSLIDYFTCASQIWEGENGDSITIATKSGNIITYTISNGQMKLVSQIQTKKPYQFDYITAQKKGQVIIFSENKCQSLYINNKYIVNNEEAGCQLRPFWGMGQISNQNLIYIDSPAIHQRVCTLSSNKNLKLWSFNCRQRKILFEQRLTNQPSQIAMHPCGMLLAINYVKEIKLMSLMHTGFCEVASAKTNYNSIGLKYSGCGNILVSNEQNLLMFYNPFNLKALGYIQPSKLKCTILDFQLTYDGSFIVFHTSDFCLYIQSVQLLSYNKIQNTSAAHSQKQVYKCFYFNQNLNKHDGRTKQIKGQSIFIGCTQQKYMVLYKNYGKQLIAQFPVEDCHIHSLSVSDGWLFAATSKSTVRVYKWPIQEKQLKLQIIDRQKKILKLKQPFFRQYSFWGDIKKITSFHKLGFSNKLAVAREGGSLTILSYDNLVVQKYQQSGERNKLTQIINDTFYITKHKSQKMNRLIEKTQGDILKAQIQIQKEKSVLQRKFAIQYRQIQKNFEQKNDLTLVEKIKYLSKIKQENQQLKKSIQNRKIQIQAHEKNKKQTIQVTTKYQDQRNKKIEDSIKEIVIVHKKKIQEKIDKQKTAIANLKSSYRQKIKTIRRQFEIMVARQYPAFDSLKRIAEEEAKQVQNRKTSLQVGSTYQINKQLSKWTNTQKQIGQISEKVQEIATNNLQLQQTLQEVECKARNAQAEDQDMQKQFQKYLQMYNSSRFTNLGLHSDILKIRTQLFERKQIMQNKQEVINVAFQERQKLQNYKQLVKGSLSKLQSQKQQLHQQFTQKEHQVSLVFQQLYSSLLEFQKLKRDEEKSLGFQKILLKNKNEEQNKLKGSINRLKQLKRFLLLQGLTDDIQRKKMYVQRQKLLNNVNFYKKRLNMESIKEKKNKIIKKSTLHLVLKQNKNLIEQCNQLRGQTIKYDHQIKNLGKRIGQANHIISIETKLKDQKDVVIQQRNQLQAIIALFTDQISDLSQPIRMQMNDI